MISPIIANTIIARYGIQVGREKDMDPIRVADLKSTDPNDHYMYVCANLHFQKHRSLKMQIFTIITGKIIKLRMYKRRKMLIMMVG